jgi:hypothetical protein
MVFLDASPVIYYVEAPACQDHQGAGTEFVYALRYLNPHNPITAAPAAASSSTTSVHHRNAARR